MISTTLAKKSNRWFSKTISTGLLLAFTSLQILPPGWAQVISLDEQIQRQIPEKAPSELVASTPSVEAPKTSINFLQNDSPLSAPDAAESKPSSDDIVILSPQGAGSTSVDSSPPSAEQNNGFVSESESDPDANPNPENGPRIICVLPCGGDPWPEPPERVPNSDLPFIKPEPLDPKIQVTEPIQPIDSSLQDQIQYGEVVPVESRMIDLGEPIQPVEEEKESSYPGLGGVSIYAYSTAVPSEPDPTSSVVEFVKQKEAEQENPSREVVRLEEKKNAFHGNASMTLTVVVKANEDEKPNPPPQASVTDQALLAAQALLWRLSFQKAIDSRSRDSVLPRVGFHSLAKSKDKTKVQTEENQKPSLSSRIIQRRKQDRQNLLIRLKDEENTINDQEIEVFGRLS